mgnify:CR=1 FL=1
MKIKRTFQAFSHRLLWLSAAFVLFSCSFFSHDDESSGGRARLFLSVNKGSSRTILPSDIGEDEISRIDFTAYKASSLEPVQEWSWWSNQDEGKSALDCMKGDTSLCVDEGSYDFALVLYTTVGDEELIFQTGSIKNKSVTSGANSLVFNTSFPSDGSGKGGISITLKWKASQKISRIEGSLLTAESGGEQAVPGYEGIGLDTSVAGTSSSFKLNSLSQGTYFIRFRIYALSGGGEEKAVNTVEDLVRVLPGLCTQATLDLSEILNTFYTIDYKLMGGSWNGSFEPVTERNASKIITLPTEDDISRPGYVFRGWFESDDDGVSLTGDEIEKIGAGTARNLVLYAKWMMNSDLYVSESGSDITGSGSESLPFATMEKALKVIKEKGSASDSYTIHVSGTIRENVMISDITGSSLVIKGESGSSSDILNGDTDGDGTGNGTVVTVQTAVPVTIKNIKITGGKENGGGGLFVGTDADVTISTGCEISGNQSTTNGGGVYISGGILSMTGGVISGNTASSSGGGVCLKGGSFFMSGSAVIGDITKTTAATATSFSNRSGTNHGGGIYVENAGGKVYIGYTKSASGSPVADSSFTGGICYNYSGYQGGGIYSSGSSAIIKMQGGKIAYNGTKSDGGGIRLGGSGDTFEMGGGSITGNKANGEATGNGGGGIYAGVSTSGSIVISGGSVSDNSAWSGGGIYASRPITLSGNAVISGNEATGTSGSYGGGGILMSSSASENCAIIMGGNALVKNNSAIAGGGILMQTGFLYIGYKAAESVDSSFTGGINGNTAETFGGGVRLENSPVVKMSGGTINDNKAFSGDASVNTIWGGGLFVGGGGKFYMLGGTISGNSSSGNGGAIYIDDDACVYMTGGKVSGNSASAGKAIYQNGELTMGGSALVESDNDIYLPVYFYVHLSGSLSALAAATITPEEYTAGIPVLKNDNSGSDYLTSEYGKFGLTQPATSGGKWIIQSDGTLAQEISGGISVGLPDFTDADLALKVMGTGSSYLFTAKSGYESYLWTVNGKVYTTTTNSITIPKEEMQLTNTLLLVATDEDGNVYGQTVSTDSVTSVPANGAVICGKVYESFDYQNYSSICSDIASARGDATIALGSGTSSILLLGGLQAIKNSLNNNPNANFTVDLSAMDLSLITQGYFAGINNVSSIIFPENLETINSDALTQLGLKGTITLPASLKTIGIGAFYNNPNLEKVIFAGGGTWNIKYTSGTVLESSYDVTQDTEKNAERLQDTSEDSARCIWSKN